nr:hypothetical protein [Microbacterium ureisolvens]
MSEASTTSRESRILDIVTVFVLSITAVLTAWCGFEASKWGGEMSIAFSQASSARIQATAAEGTARDARLYDLSMFTEWVLAEEAGNDDLRVFIEERFTPEFAVAFDVWEAGGRTERGPLAMDEYVPPGTGEAAQLTAEADEKFEQALENNQRGDNYSLLTVLFALVLFLTAMSQRDVALWVRRTLLGLGIVVGIAGVIIMLTFPIKI